MTDCRLSRNKCSKKKANLILESVQADGDTKRKGQEYRDFLVRSLVNQVRDVHREMKYVEDNICDIMQKLDFKLNTFTGIGDISRFSNADKLAKYAGLTPSQMSSGGRGSKCSTPMHDRDFTCSARTIKSIGIKSKK